MPAVYKRQLVDEAGDAQVIVADDGLLCIEDLAHLQGHLGLFEGTGQVFDPHHHGADAHSGVGAVLAVEGVDDGTSQLLHILRIDHALEFFD